MLERLKKTFRASPEKGEAQEVVDAVIFGPDGAPVNEQDRRKLANETKLALEEAKTAILSNAHAASTFGRREWRLLLANRRTEARWQAQAGGRAKSLARRRKAAKRAKIARRVNG